MAKKAETHFALLAAAFTADEQMARQVCSLLANRHIDEPEAKMMLALVGDGLLKTSPHIVYRWQTNATVVGAAPAPWAYTTTTTTAPPRTLPSFLCAKNDGIYSLTEAAKAVA